MLNYFKKFNLVLLFYSNMRRQGDIQGLKNSQIFTRNNHSLYLKSRDNEHWFCIAFLMKLHKCSINMTGILFSLK